MSAPKFKVGDRVRLTGYLYTMTPLHDGTPRPNGYEFTVKRVTPTSRTTFYSEFPNGKSGIGESVLERVKFPLGSKVRITSNTFGSRFEGKVGTLVEPDPVSQYRYRVDFGFDWLPVKEAEIELAPTFKVGDRVRIKPSDQLVVEWHNKLGTITAGYSHPFEFNVTVDEPEYGSKVVAVNSDEIELVTPVSNDLTIDEAVAALKAAITHGDGAEWKLTAIQEILEAGE